MSKQIPNDAINEQNVVNSNEQSNVVQTNNIGYQNVVKKLIASGCKRINSIRIKNVNFTDKDNYTMISFTLASPIKGFISDDGGVTYKEGITNTIFTSLYAITGALKEDENLGWMANALLTNPQAINLIFNGSTVDILQQDISAGTEFKNPFTTKDDASIQVYDHDIIINHIISFKLGQTGQQMANRLADKLMGF